MKVVYEGTENMFYFLNKKLKLRYLKEVYVGASTLC